MAPAGSAEPRQAPPALEPLRNHTLVQTNMEKLPVEMNPFGNGFRVVETELQQEQQAKRCTDPHAGRTWKIKNPQRIHPVTGAGPD